MSLNRPLENNIGALFIFFDQIVKLVQVDFQVLAMLNFLNAIKEHLVYSLVNSPVYNYNQGYSYYDLYDDNDSRAINIEEEMHNGKSTCPKPCDFAS